MDVTFTDDGTGAPKLETVSRTWGEIQAENKRDRKWVTEEQWKQWEEYDRATAKKLSDIIERFDGVSLSLEDSATLDEIISAVKGVKRVTEKEFIAEHEATQAAEREREQQRIAAAERQKALKGFKATLRGLFSSK